MSQLAVILKNVTKSDTNVCVAIIKSDRGVSLITLRLIIHLVALNGYVMLSLEA